jgi:hypothetical protein
MLYAFKSLKGGKPSNCSRTIRSLSLLLFCRIFVLWLFFIYLFYFIYLFLVTMIYFPRQLQRKNTSNEKNMQYMYNIFLLFAKREIDLWNTSEKGCLSQLIVWTNEGPRRKYISEFYRWFNTGEYTVVRVLSWIMG